MTEFVTEGHLGGYIRGGDPATYYEVLWTWLVNDYGVRSVIDVGCGEGHALKFFRDLGCAVIGIDGVAQEDPAIIQHDYTEAAWPLDVHVEHPDLVWSCEFVEHVEERFMLNFLLTFAHAETVLMTHAETGQQGHHHVNCQSADYWKGAMAAIGYEFDPWLSTLTRELASENTNPHNHFIRSGLAFKRYDT